MIMDASFQSFALEHWVKAAGMPIEEMVRRLTSDTALSMGLTDRGVLRAGLKADLNVIDLEKLTIRRPEIVNDLPSGGKRLMQRADGYVATLVNGVVTYRNGKHTGALPGRLVRCEGGRAEANGNASLVSSLTDREFISYPFCSAFPAQDLKCFGFGDAFRVVRFCQPCCEVKSIIKCSCVQHLIVCLGLLHQKKTKKQKAPLSVYKKQTQSPLPLHILFLYRSVTKLCTQSRIFLMAAPGSFSPKIPVPDTITFAPASAAA